MTTFESTIRQINYPQQNVYNKLSDLSNLQALKERYELMKDTMPVSSWGDRGTCEPSDVVSMTAIRRFVMGRSAEGGAWGMTMRDMVCGERSPIEQAASIWPTPIVLMPLMKFSEPKAEPMRTVVTMTQVR